jgi:enolase-phosphatase E1
MPIRAVLTDIEGTTSSVHFVHQVLFPYATKAIPDFLRAPENQTQLRPWLREIGAEIGNHDISVITDALLQWIQADRKHTALKAIQGMVWAQGYKSGVFKAHLYPEVAAQLTQWHQTHKLYVYSSGSIAAQKLFFGHSEAGNLLPIFDGFFDTTSGNKRESESYLTISRAIGFLPGEILFLSDIEAELDAANAIGMATALLAREMEPTSLADQATRQTSSAHKIARNFNEISL